MRKTFLLTLLLGFIATSQSFADVVVANNGSYDFESINIISHRSKPFWSAEGFQILGNISGAKTVIQGIYAKQSTPVVDHCLALAAQLSINSHTGSPILRFQVIPDPAKKGFSIIQFCELNN